MAPLTASRFQLILNIIKIWWHERQVEEEAEEEDWESCFQEWSIDSDDHWHERDTAQITVYRESSSNELIVEYNLDELTFADTPSPRPEDYEQPVWRHPDSPVAHEFELEDSLR